MRGKHRHQWITWLAMIALAAQTWLGPLALSAAAGQANGLVICTGAGFKLIPLPAADGSSPDSPGGPSAGLDCLACLHGALGQAAIASVAAPTEPIERDSANFHVAHQAPTAKPCFGTARSRAPPLI